MKLSKPFEIPEKHLLLADPLQPFSVMEKLGVRAKSKTKQSERRVPKKSRQVIFRDLTTVFDRFPSWNEMGQSDQEDITNRIVRSLLFISFCSLDPGKLESSEYYENFVDDVSEIILMSILDFIYKAETCDDTCYPGMVLSPDRELRNFLQSNQKLKEIAQEVAKRAATQVLSPTCYLKKYKLIATLMDLAGAPIEHFVFFSYERRFFINLQYRLNTDNQNGEIPKDLPHKMREVFLEAIQCPEIVLKVFRQFAKQTRVNPMNPLVLEKINQSQPRVNGSTSGFQGFLNKDFDEVFTPAVLSKKNGKDLEKQNNGSENSQFPRIYSYARLIEARKLCDFIDSIGAGTKLVNREAFFEDVFYTRKGIESPDSILERFPSALSSLSSMRKLTSYYFETGEKLETPLGVKFGPYESASSNYLSLKIYRNVELSALVEESSQSRSIRNFLHYVTLLASRRIPTESELISIGVEFLAVLESPATPRQYSTSSSSRMFAAPSGWIDSNRDYYQTTDLLELLGRISRMVEEKVALGGVQIILVEDINQPSGEFFNDFCKIMGIIEKKNGVKPFIKALEEYVPRENEKKIKVFVKKDTLFSFVRKKPGAK